MRKDLKILALTLTIPLAFYGIGYAYAEIITSTYVVMNSGFIPGGTSQSISASCNSGDFVTGGGFDTDRATQTFSKIP